MKEKVIFITKMMMMIIIGCVSNCAVSLEIR